MDLGFMIWLKEGDRKFLRKFTLLHFGLAAAFIGIRLLIPSDIFSLLAGLHAGMGLASIFWNLSIKVDINYLKALERGAKVA